MPKSPLRTVWQGTYGTLIDVYSTIEGLAFSPNGRMLAIVSEDGRVLGLAVYAFPDVGILFEHNIKKSNPPAWQPFWCGASFPVYSKAN